MKIKGKIMSHWRLLFDDRQQIFSGQEEKVRVSLGRFVKIEGGIKSYNETTTSNFSENQHR